MKKLLPLSFSIFYLFSFPCFAQNDTIWFNSNWKETSKKDAPFFRLKPTKKGDAYYVVDYFMNGSKQMEGLSKYPGKDMFIGPITWYYENGKIFQIAYYENGIQNGNRKVYYENGKLKTDSNYLKGRLDGKWKTFYENGNIEETGSYVNGQKEGHWETYYINGKLFKSGKYVSDQKIDKWKTNYYDGSEQN